MHWQPLSHILSVFACFLLYWGIGFTSVFVNVGAALGPDCRCRWSLTQEIIKCIHNAQMNMACFDEFHILKNQILCLVSKIWIISKN